MAIEKNRADTPLMKQYFDIKAKYPDTIMLYRVGDFYETFGEDAITTSKVLGIVLTRKASGNGTYTELAGIPYHAIDLYLPRLVRAGHKVAVCDQLEDPKLTKKIVKRGVTELVTPGVSFNDNLLEQKENNFLAAAVFEKDRTGIAFLDISTGTFRVGEGSTDYIEVLLSDFKPKEVILKKGYSDGFKKRFGSSYYITSLDEWVFVYESSFRKLKEHFKTDTLKGFGIEKMPLGITAAGSILFYLEMTEHNDISHIRSLSRIDEKDFVWMDRFTLNNLEIFNSFAGAEGSSLLDVIDKCSSPMGSRKLREWLSMPLIDKEKIKKRLDAVECLTANPDIRDTISADISNIGDLERIISKAAAGRIMPREILQLGRGLKSISKIIDEASQLTEIKDIIGRLERCDTLSSKIGNTILPDSAQQLGKGSVIACGISKELDDFRNILEHSKEILLNIQQTEKERTGISSLKVSYNNVFGYYLEVRNTHSDKVPPEWIRKQTLVNAERYITPELKEYEEKILGAEERILSIETAIYKELVIAIQQQVNIIQKNAVNIAILDCLAGFARLAKENNYCKPIVNNSLEIKIKNGRHPVIETLMPPGEEYIANDLYLNNDTQQIIILTGPNMAGKSAFLRQTALIVLLSQIGSFVPAESAEIGIIDKLFTRVGASDNISRGESTFMVEMIEASTILHNISQRSLVLLDEIGRGTSTYDGMSIAWAIVEYLHNGDGKSRECHPKTLFATHYHELNELEKILPRVKNFHISTKEKDGQVVFLRKLKEGGVSHSFGIHVARLAGMPDTVVQNAEKKLHSLESEEATPQQAVQLSLYQLDDPLLVDIRDELQKIDINKLSPLDAFDIIRKLKRKIGL